MGILTGYLIYKSGKRKAEKACQSDEAYWSEICEFCGYERRQHSRDREARCPSYK